MKKTALIRFLEYERHLYEFLYDIFGKECSSAIFFRSDKAAATLPYANNASVCVVEDTILIMLEEKFRVTHSLIKVLLTNLGMLFPSMKPADYEKKEVRFVILDTSGEENYADPEVDMNYIADGHSILNVLGNIHVDVLHIHYDEEDMPEPLIKCKLLRDYAWFALMAKNELRQDGPAFEYATQNNILRALEDQKRGDPDNKVYDFVNRVDFLDDAINEWNIDHFIAKEKEESFRLGRKTKK